MATIHYRTSHLRRPEKKRIREFLKNYETEDLSIVFADKWVQLVQIWSRKESRYIMKWRSLGSRCLGKYWWKSNGGYMLGIGGVKRVYLPAIIVRCDRDDWWETFLHEFGHYLHDKTEGLRKRMWKERYAEHFASTKMDTEYDHLKKQPQPLVKQKPPES